MAAATITQNHKDTERKYLTKSTVGAATPYTQRDRFVWDCHAGPKRQGVIGFGLRVRPSGHKSFILQYRIHGRPKRVTLGQVGEMTVQQARADALTAREKIRKSKDPVAEKGEARKGKVTVADLAKRFIEDHASRKSPSTKRNYGLLWDRHILPALKHKPVPEVTWADISALHYKMRKKPVMANRMLSLVSKAWSLAQKWGWFPRDAMNPGREHDKHSENRDRGVGLDKDQLRTLGLALESDSSEGAKAIRLTLLCGARPGEILRLRWNDLEADHRIANLPNSKTGPRKVYFGTEAARLISDQSRLGKYLFPAGSPRITKGKGKLDPDRPLFDLKSVWTRVKQSAKLDQNVRLYDATRHTFATWAEELGVDEIRRKRLVGHSITDITAGYTHTRRNVLLSEADRISGHLAAMLDGRPVPEESTIEPVAAAG